MITTPVLKLAAQNPSLGHFLTLLCDHSELKANVHLSKTLVKCILYIAMGPRDDKHLDQNVRAKNRSQALRWALDRLSSLKCDSIQSFSRFKNIPEFSPLAQGQLMTDLGFSQTVLSGSVVSTLSSQLLLKLEKVDALVLANESFLASKSSNSLIKAPKFSAQKYVSFRYSISLKCVPLLDNGPFVRPLLEQLILSPVRNNISNSFSCSTQSEIESPSSKNHDMKPSNRCICGLSSELIERLWANSGSQFEKLSSAAKAHLLHQCPASLSNELTRVIRLVNARPLTSKSTIEVLAAHLIDAGFHFASVFIHVTSVLRQLILSCMHPMLIRLYQVISEGLHSRLKNEKRGNLFMTDFGLYWPSPLVYILSTEPKDARQYLNLNMALESSIKSRIWTLNSELSSEPPVISNIQKAWFILLAFPKWIDFAYDILTECDLSELDAENHVFELIKFLAFNAHPISHESRERAIEDFKIHLPRMKSLYNGDSPYRNDFLSGALEADAVVHPLLIRFWHPSIRTETSIFCNIVSELLARNPHTITLDTILTFLEEVASIAVPSGKIEISFAAKHIWTVIETNHALSSNKDVKNRIEMLF